jgi:hypothetical protein
MTPDRITMHKVVPQATVKCRKCRTNNETLAHILGQCIHTKRHDETRDLLAQKISAQEGSQLIEEALVATSEGANLKPDLVVVSEGKVHVLDVTVRHEENEYPQVGYRSKIEK